MKNAIVIFIIMAFLMGCKTGKPKQQTKEKCDTCPSLSNEGKIAKPFKKKKK